MSVKKEKDNTTLEHKTRLRLATLAELAAAGVDAPIVMETHAGDGRVWFRCYRQLHGGIAIEKHPEKVDRLARQRPTWSIYEAACEKALAAGAGRHTPIDLLDLDPYGDPWPAIRAFFESRRPFAPTMAIAVNDGNRQFLAGNLGWKYQHFQPAIARFGNHRLYHEYTDVCRFMLELYAGPAGYTIDSWHAYYCGNGQRMTHYAALLHRPTPPGSDPTAAA